MRLFLAALFFTALSVHARAETRQRHFFYLGGGENVSRNSFKTNFDTSFQFIRRIEKQGWKAQFLFGGDQETAKKFREEAPDKIRPLTEQNLKNFLNQILDEMRSGKLNNSQVLLYLDTHGILERNVFHVGTTDSKLAIFPYIEEMKSLSQAHHIQFGIVGATCFSGQLLKLADQKTCVLSTAPSDTVGLMMTNNTTSFLIGNGSAQNLEDLHLKTRLAQNVEFGQPLISSHAGLKAFSILKDLRTTLLLAGKKAAAEIEIADEKAILKTIEQLTRFVQEQKENSMIPQETFQALTSLGFKLQSILRQHRNSLVSVLKSGCDSKNQLSEVCLFSESQPKESSIQTDHEANSVMTDKTKFSQTSNEVLPFQILDDLVQTASEVGHLERALYSKLYEKFKAEQTSPSACEQFSLK